MNDWSMILLVLVFGQSVQNQFLPALKGSFFEYAWNSRVTAHAVLNGCVTNKSTMPDVATWARAKIDRSWPQLAEITQTFGQQNPEAPKG